MSKKLRCVITGNVIYMTDQRYAKLISKFGSEEALKVNFISKTGKKVKEGLIEKPETINNRIQCSVTGRYCYISNERMQAGIKKYGSEEEFRKQYVCRPAARLLRTAVSVDTIKDMIQNGTFPES